MALPEMEVRVTADTRDAEAGFDRVGNAARESASNVNRMAARTRAAGQVMGRAVNDNNRFGRSIQNVSFQVGDFAAQVGAGTSASIALGQQLPQLLGGFGALGAAMGAVVAIGVPLIRVLSNIEGGSKELENALGPLVPVMQSIGGAFTSLKNVAQEAIVDILNNMGRLLTISGTIATLLAGRFVAGMVAARIATFSLAGAVGAVNASLSLLRKLLILTGIGALAVAVGELVWQFIDLNSELRTFLAGLGLISAQNLAQVDERIAKVRQEIETIQNKIRQGPMLGLDQLTMQALSESLVEANQELDELMRKRLELQAMANQELPTFTVEGVFGGRGEGEQGDPESDAQRERLQTQLDQIRESQMTERELLMAHLAEKKAILDEALAAELVARQEHAELTKALESGTASEIQAIDRRQAQAALSQTVQAGQMIASAVAGNNKKVMAAARALGMFEALVNAYRAAAQTLADPTLPWFAKAAAAASILATGIGFVSSIAGIGGGGGGGGGGGAGQTATSAPPPATPKPLDVFIQGVGPSDLISGGQLSSLFDKLVEEAGDRGIRPVFAQ